MVDNYAFDCVLFVFDRTFFSIIVVVVVSPRAEFKINIFTYGASNDKNARCCIIEIFNQLYAMIFVSSIFFSLFSLDVGVALSAPSANMILCKNEEIEHMGGGEEEQIPVSFFNQPNHIQMGRSQRKAMADKNFSLF